MNPSGKFFERERERKKRKREKVRKRTKQDLDTSDSHDFSWKLPAPLAANVKALARELLSKAQQDEPLQQQFY